MREQTIRFGGYKQSCQQITSQKVCKEAYKAYGIDGQIRKHLCGRNMPLMMPSLTHQTHLSGSCLNDIFQYLSYIAVSDIRMCEHGSAAASGEMVLRYHLTQ